MSIVSKFFAGVLLANAVPHGVNAVQGHPFPTPFAKPPGVGLSSPLLNMVWSTINLAGGAAVLRWSKKTPADTASLALGAVSMGFFLAWYFGGAAKTRGDSAS
ncbi:MAG: hypothetical protein JWQ43_2660 [Glaciihabitans sp.]|nr:hypothetical protein [Glaciihabitans sp.]